MLQFFLGQRERISSPFLFFFFVMVREDTLGEWGAGGVGELRGREGEYTCWSTEVECVFVCLIFCVEVSFEFLLRITL